MQHLVTAVKTGFTFPAYAHLYIGFIFAEFEQYHNAITAYNNALAIDVHFADAYLFRGVTYYHMNEHQNAAADCILALRYNVAEHFYGQAYDCLGRSYYKLGRYEKAIESFTTLIAFDASQFDAYIQRALVYRKQMKYDKAISDYSRYLENKPRALSIVAVRGKLYEMTKHYDKALSDYEHILSFQADNAEIVKRKAIVLQKIKTAADIVQPV